MYNTPNSKEVVEVENEFVNASIDGIIEHNKDITTLANKYLNKWTIDRLGNTDQAIIRMAIYELLYTKTPGIVVINEAVELAKKYASDVLEKGLSDKYLK